MKHLFIGKDAVTWGAGVSGVTDGIWGLNALTDGALAIFDNDGTFLPGTASDGSDEATAIQVAVGTTNPMLSVMIPYKGFSYKKATYVAPDQAEKFVGSDTAGSAGSYSLNLPTALTVGDLVGIGIKDLSKPYEQTAAYKEYSFNVVSGDLLTGTAVPNIIAKLVALINADDNAIVTATALTDGTDNDGIKLVADTAGNDFAISHIGGILQDADIVEYKQVNGVYTAGSTTAVKNNPGQGTPAQILQLEKDLSVREGHSNGIVLDNVLWTVPSKVEAVQYVTYTLEFESDNYTDMIRPRHTNQQVTIATSTSSVVALLDKILAAFVTRVAIT